MIRPTIAAVALLVVPVFVLAQADNTAAPPVDAGSHSTSEAPPFVASLLLIKADWSQSPAAKDIDADLRKALNRDIVSKDKFEGLPKTAVTILFPSENAAVYSQEHYAQFLAWLKEKQLIQHTEPIPIHGSSFTYQYPGREPVSIGMAMLFKRADFTESDASEATNGSKAATNFMWSISAGTIGNWSLSYGPVLDRTQSSLRPRASESQPFVPEPGTEYDGGKAYFPPPREGQAIILHTFPANDDANLRAAVDGRGLLALMVIEKEKSSNSESPKPRFWVPDSTKKIAAAHIRGTYSRIVDNTKPEADPAANADSRSIATGSQVISWSAEKDESWGFSKSLNKAARQVLSPPAKAKPWVKEHVALWSLKSSFCAYSATAGRWDVLHLPNEGAIVSVADEYAVINVGDRIFTFTASSGRWSPQHGDANKQDPTLTPLATKTADPPQTTVRGAPGSPRLSPPAAKTSDLESAFGFARAGVPSGTDPHRYYVSNEVMIRWSEANDAAWGFSKSLGRWAKQEINPPADQSPWRSEPVTLFVGDNVAVWRVGSSYYAYSGQTGRWDVLRLPEGRAPKPFLGDNLVFVNDTDNDYAFAASTGRWSSPKGSAEAPDINPVDPQIKIFTLRNAKANDARHLIEQLFPRDIQSVASDPRSNSLIVRGPPEQLDIIFAILTRLDGLDEDLGSNQTARAGRPPTGLPKGESGGMFGTIFEPGSSAESVEELAKKYNDKEQQALGLAKQIRELKASGNADLSRVSVLTAELRRAVGEAFAARQKLHHAEVGLLQQRIAGIQKNVATRDLFSEKIIDVRVNDLLNPELQWESSPRLPGGASATGTRAAFTPSTIQPNATMGAWWGPESEQILQDLGLQVQRLTRDDAPEPNLIGALKITSIAPDSPARELQVGEVIRGLQTTSGSRKGWRRVEIHFRRGNQSLSVVFELPNQPLFSATPATNATFATSPGKGTTTVPGLNMPLDAKATTIRSAEEFHRRIDSALSKVESIKEEPLSAYVGKDAAEQAATKQWNLDRAERELAFLRDEHAAQLRLLELEIQDASSALESASEQRSAAQKRYANWDNPREGVLPFDRAVQEADLRLQRAKILLDLYRKADPKDPAPQPAVSGRSNKSRNSSLEPGGKPE